MGGKTKNVALVLSGGGARGMAHIGIIEELLARGYKITSIAGTSIGSVVGGIYAAGNLDGYKDWITSLSRLDIFKLMDFAISKSGLIKGEKVFNEVKKIIGNKNIEDLNIPFAAIAVDINKHKEVVFTTGSLISAIRASVSIPTVLLPFEYNGLELVDGGVLNPLPLDHVKRTDNDILVAVDLNADIPYKKPAKINISENHHSNYLQAIERVNLKWSKFFRNNKQKKTGYFDLITNSIYAMQAKLTKIAIEKHKPDILINISKDACDIFEFHRAEEMIEYGKKQFKAMIKIKKV